MNFQELMNKATKNTIIATKQKKKAGHLHKDSTPGVSSSAVQAFLAKKEQEAKRRQADEEAARRARIQARIEHDQQYKRGTKRQSTDSGLKSTFSNPSHCEDHQKPAKVPKREKQVSHGSDKVKIKSTSSTMNAKSDFEKERTKSSKHSEKAKGLEVMKEKTIYDPSKPVQNGNKPKTSKSKKVKARPPPPNFKELLAIAERNKLGLNNIKEKSVQNKAKNQHKLPSKETQIIKERDNKDNQKVARKEEKRKSKEKIKEHKSFPKPKATETKQSKFAKQQRAYEPIDKKRTPSSRDINGSKPPRPGTNLRGSHKPTSRLQQQSTYKPQRKYMGYYDEEDDDMDGFIDDEEVEPDGDVSAHIREIFGYDRRRFADMEDFDDAAMESSYSQIEKEEHRSSKIAKLEDDIALLKEQAELKKQREKLLRDQKKTRKK